MSNKSSKLNQLTEKVSIYQRNYEQESAGLKAEYVFFIDVYAAIKHIKSYNQFDNGYVATSEVYEVILRNPPLIEVGMKLKWQDKWLQIISAPIFSHRQAYQTIMMKSDEVIV